MNRDNLNIMGRVHWVAENPPESGIKMPNGEYRMEGEVENVATDGLFDALVDFMIDGTADITDKITVMALGDDITTPPARDDTNVNSPVHAQGDMPDVINATGTASSTASSGAFNDTFTISNTWINNGSDEDVGEVALRTFGSDGSDGDCCAHTRFVTGSLVTISGTAGTLTITYKLIFAPA